jgi:stearoyl-CoA desaturase (Delta-9 desaturase)
LSEFWKALAFAVITGHFSGIFVSIYLHRAMAHRSVVLRPIASIPMRIWLWLGTGMVTKEWIAVHRKHHSFVDVEGDPHSPFLLGITRVVFGGVHYYSKAIKDQAMVEKYGVGAPSDWIERNIFTRFKRLGIIITFFIDQALFPGILGLMIWGIQMIWIPLFAAGVVNGIGHWFGYRNFKIQDQSRNFVPWGILLAGGELHNNHHADLGSARFSRRWWEFDIGWMYIKILQLMGLAKVEPARPVS